MIELALIAMTPSESPFELQEKDQLLEQVRPEETDALSGLWLVEAMLLF